ncbi:YciI-like protein [Galbibacter sp. PAP.153]|uniref:YciI-like protein n=1 Tax=Galbibacter sp. PAP.153 TaxID=3104623 RepID=UPI00300949EE
MNYYALFYQTVPNYLEERAQYRNEHLRLAQKYVGNGHLLLGGALENPAGGALLLFVGETDDMAKAFAQEDPYVVNGLIKSWQVRRWNVVVGNK